MTRVPLDKLGPAARAQIKQQDEATAARSKYRNKKPLIDGIRWDSIAEAAYYLELLHRQAVGEVEYFLRQVPIPLQLDDNSTYRIDFQVFMADGCTVDYVDVKGLETEAFRLRKKIVESRYPIKIRLVRREDIGASFLQTASQMAELNLEELDS